MFIATLMTLLPFAQDSTNNVNGTVYLRPRQTIKTGSVDLLHVDSHDTTAT